jgi:hypothetical protein
MLTLKDIDPDEFGERTEGPIEGQWVVRNKMTGDYFHVTTEDGVSVLITFDGKKAADTFIKKYDVSDAESYCVPVVH